MKKKEKKEYEINGINIISSIGPSNSLAICSIHVTSLIHIYLSNIQSLKYLFSKFSPFLKKEDAGLNFFAKEYSYFLIVTNSKGKLS